MCKRSFLLTIVFAILSSTWGQAQSPFFLGRINSVLDAFARMTATQAKSQAQARHFFGQLTAILAAGEVRHFAGIKGRLLITSDDGQKTYDCTLPLAGFMTTLSEKAGVTEFNARSISYAATNANVLNLMNEIARELDGMPGYLNHENAAEHFTDAGEHEAITMLTKKDVDIKLLIYKMPSQGGYFLIAR